MRSLLVFLVATALVVGITWAAALSSGRPQVARRDPDWLAKRAEPLAGRIGESLQHHFGPSAQLPPLLLSAAMHAVFVGHALVLLVPALVGAAALGLFRRDAARTLAKFSSPTLAFGAKRLFLAAAVTLAVFAFTPAALPYWVVYSAFGAMAISSAIYVENIPVRI